IIPWKDWTDVALSPDEASGLTFIAYLQEKYRHLAALNHAWGTDYADWSVIFPPLPDVDPAREDDDSGAPEFDIGEFNPGKHPRPTPPAGREAAWADWTRFWAHNINDELREYVALGEQLEVKIPVTTNSIGGHMLTK